jgi:hypothetical protein
MSSVEKSESVPLPFEFKKMEMKKTLTLDPRVFKPCKPKEVEQWSWRRMKNEKWLVHLRKYIYKLGTFRKYIYRWSIKKLTP